MLSGLRRADGGVAVVRRATDEGHGPARERIGVAVALLLPRREADAMVVRGEIVGAYELMVGVEKVPRVDQHRIKTRRRSKSADTTLAGRLYGMETRYKCCHASQSGQQHVHLYPSDSELFLHSYRCASLMCAPNSIFLFLFN